jgi:hypothetical protein
VDGGDFVENSLFLLQIISFLKIPDKLFGEFFSALNFLVLTTALKLLIFKISVRTFLRNFSFRKELKLFATSSEFKGKNDLRTKRNSEP